MTHRIPVALAVFAMACLRFAHHGILWVEEAYPMAAAQQLLRGRVLYRDIWFDKPPGFAWFYAAFGAQNEWALRAMGVGFVLLTAVVAAWAAHRIWGKGGESAALLTAFFFSFDFPATAVALTPDLLSAPLHLACLAFAATGQPTAAGLCAGAAMLINTKAALFVVAAALLLAPAQWPRLLAAALLPNALLAIYLQSAGALEAYRLQVWTWGSAYSRDTFVTSPLLEGMRRTFNWAGFHISLLLLAFVALRTDRRRWQWAAIALLSVMAAWLGLRFFPRYFFHALPPLILLAAAGMRPRESRVALMSLCLLLVPLARFGPRYVKLALGSDPEWSDAAMARDGRAAAKLVMSQARPGDGLLVWGYRPEILALSRVPAATRFLDSQPISGVLADRHLTSTHVSFPDLARQHRAEVLSGAMPRLIADGLGPYNPRLAVFQTGQLEAWAPAYRLCGQTGGTRLYCRKD